MRPFNALRHAYAEVKFLDTTWFGFFERFVWPKVRDRVQLGAPVAHIARVPGGGAVARLQNGQTVDADAVLVTVPLPMLQHGVLTIAPELAPSNLPALGDVVFGKGFKVFMKFAERFYPDMLVDGARAAFLNDAWSAKLYYDAAFGKPTREHLLGLFTVNEDALPRARLSDAALLDDILEELTEIFGPVVRPSFQGGHVQNWTQEPFIQGSYSMTNDSDYWIEDILQPSQGTLFFAGEALGDDAQSTVHGAAFSAIRATQQILER